MAFGLKPWWAAVALILVGTSIWVLSPPRVAPYRGQGPLPETVRFEELQGEIKRESWVYQHLQWRDSIVSALSEENLDARGVVVTLPPTAPDSLWSRIELAMDLQFRNLGLEESAMPLGIFFLPNTLGLHPEVHETYRAVGTGQEYYIARDGEDPYCAIAAPFSPVPPNYAANGRRDPVSRMVRSVAEVPQHSQATPNTLGLCRYFARYGQPGSEILSWLRDGASSFGHMVHGVDHQRWYFNAGQAMGPFGITQFSRFNLLPAGHGCLAGIAEDCREIVMEFPRNPRGTGMRRWISDNIQTRGVDSPVDFVERESGILQAAGSLEGFLFFAMEKEFGPEKFGEFWTSTHPPEEAFSEAFGVGIDLWVMGWMRNYLDPRARGPGVPVQSTLFSLLALGILAGGAVRMGRR